MDQDWNKIKMKHKDEPCFISVRVRRNFVNSPFPGRAPAEADEEKLFQNMSKEIKSMGTFTSGTDKASREEFIKKHSSVTLPENIRKLFEL